MTNTTDPHGDHPPPRPRRMDHRRQPHHGRLQHQADRLGQGPRHLHRRPPPIWSWVRPRRHDPRRGDRRPGVGRHRQRRPRRPPPLARPYRRGRPPDAHLPLDDDHRRRRGLDRSRASSPSATSPGPTPSTSTFAGASVFPPRRSAPRRLRGPHRGPAQGLRSRLRRHGRGHGRRRRRRDRHRARRPRRRRLAHVGADGRGRRRSGRGTRSCRSRPARRSCSGSSPR